MFQFFERLVHPYPDALPPPPPPPPEDAWAYHGVGGTAPVPTTPALRPGRQLFTGAPKGGVLQSEVFNADVASNTVGFRVVRDVD